jgi:hypothetical protein
MPLITGLRICWMWQAVLNADPTRRKVVNSLIRPAATASSTHNAASGGTPLTDSHMTSAQVYQVHSCLP